MSGLTPEDHVLKLNNYVEELNNNLRSILSELSITGSVRVEIEPRRCRIEILNFRECTEPCGQLITLLEDLFGLMLTEEEVRKDDKKRTWREIVDERPPQHTSHSSPAQRKLVDEMHRAFEECSKCSGAELVYGEYDCIAQKIVLYPKCLIAEPCLDTSYLTARMLETLAHELIHAGQFQGWTFIGDIPIIVHLKCGSPQHRQAESFPYRYSPHEAEAFDKMVKVANILRRTRAGTNLERALSSIVEHIVDPYRRSLISL